MSLLLAKEADSSIKILALSLQRAERQGRGTLSGLQYPAIQHRLSQRTSEEKRRLSPAESRAGLSDAALVSAVRSGKESAMAELYDRYSAVVYSVSLRVLGDTGAAEDVLQEVFLQLWRNPDWFDSSRGNLAPWLAVIARNRSIDVLRKRRPESDVEDVLLSVEPDMAGDADRAMAMTKVRAVLGGMPAAQRSMLEMAYFEGLSHSEISAKTGEPLGTVKTRIRSGLLTLRKAFQI